jgi:hypothetical protein
MLKDLESENDFFKRCTPMEESRYKYIDNDRLVLYSVYLLEENKIEPTFEKIVVTAFKLFPKRFSLLGFPNYPDARWIYYALWHCVYKTKGWLSGNPKSGYHVTAKGKEILLQTLTAFSGKVYASRKIAPKQQRKEMYFLNLIESSSAFQKYVSGKVEDITEMEIRIMLRTRKDTPNDVLKLNLEKYLEYANIANRPEITQFLEHIKKSPKWAHLFR